MTSVSGPHLLGQDLRSRLDRLMEKYGQSDAHRLTDDQALTVLDEKLAELRDRRGAAQMMQKRGFTYPETRADVRALFGNQHLADTGVTEEAAMDPITKAQAVFERVTGTAKAHAANLLALLATPDPWTEALRSRLGHIRADALEALLGACAEQVGGDGYEETRRYFVIWADGSVVEREYYKKNRYAFADPRDEVALLVYHDCLIEMHALRRDGKPPRPETVHTAVGQVARLGENMPRNAPQLMARDLVLAGVEYEAAERLAKTVVEAARERRTDAEQRNAGG